MTRYLLDAGALVAIERGDRRAFAILKAAQERTSPMATSAGVVARVWYDGARQARLATALRRCQVVDLTEPAARLIGPLLRATSTKDVVDAHVALLAGPGDAVLTSDPDDLFRLLDHLRVNANIIAV
jgi:predicted nucleic acid-binding protein